MEIISKSQYLISGIFIVLPLKESKPGKIQVGAENNPLIFFLESIFSW
jgi:hypothetical protein